MDKEKYSKNKAEELGELEELASKEELTIEGYLKGKLLFSTKGEDLK